MTRPTDPTIGQLVSPENLQPGFEFEEIPMVPVVAADCTEGRWSDVPRDKIPMGSFSVAKNARVVSQGIKRRDGTKQFLTKPDSNAVLLLVGMKDQTGASKLIRIAGAGAHHSSNGGAWTAYVNNAPTVLDGSVIKPNADAYLDNLYVCGWTDLLKFTDSTKTITAITDPGQAKYILNAADRILLANFANEPYKIKWSANGDPDDWTGDSSGEENLVQGSTGLGDQITGLFNLSNEVIILREQSIWTGIRQPFQTAPFRFVQDVPNMGCDLPNSAVRVPGGIIYADLKTKGIYFYQMGSLPQRINTQICDCLFDAIVNTQWVQAAYNPQTFSYHIGLATNVNATTMQEFWIYNILEQAWTHDDGPTTAQSMTHFAEGALSIDQLTGDINSLSGTIDNLANFVGQSALYIGLSSGEVLYFDPSQDTDFGSVAFELELVSQNLGSLTTRRTLQDLVLNVEYNRPGTVHLDLSKDGTNFTAGKNVLLSSITHNRVRARKNLITGHDVYWRLTASSSDVLVKNWWARLQEKGYQQ